MSSVDATAAIPKITVLLGRINYKKWARELVSTAMLGGYSTALLGTNELPTEITDSKEITAFNLRDQLRLREEKAHGLIQRSVSEPIAQELLELSVSKYKTVLGLGEDTKKSVPADDDAFMAHHFLQYLKAKYEKKDAVSAILDWRQLNRAILVDDGALEKQLDHLYELRSRCTLHGLKIEDYQFAANILASLPDSYQSLLDSLLAITSIESLSLDTVRSKILEQEVRHKESASANLIRQSTNHASSSNNQSKGSKPNKACFNCGKTGHWAKSCRSKKKSSDAVATTESSNRPPDPKGKGKPPSNSQLNVIESSSSANNNTVFWYAQSDSTPEDWVLDSGATDHMTPYGTDFLSGSYILGHHARSVVLGDGQTRLTIRGTGTIERWIPTESGHKQVVIRNVLLVDGIKRRFLSTRRLMNSGFEITFKGDHAVIVSPDRSYRSTGASAGPLFIHHLYKRDPTSIQLNAVEALPITLWHERMGHLDWDALKRVWRNDPSPLIGIKLNSAEPHAGPCDGCLAGKDSRRAFKSKSSGTRSSEPLELVHADLAGPMETQSITGYSYYFVLVDDGTRIAWVYFLRKKDETYDRFVAWVTMIETLTGRKIKFFRSDRGGEFMGAEFTKFLEEHGITRQTSAPNTPEQNGLAERTNRTLVGTARSMMQHAGLSKGFWSEATAVATYLHNRSPRKGLNWMTPHELFFGRIPDITHLRVFGCQAWVHTPKSKRKKWDATSKQMVLIGYEPGSKAYRLWNPTTKTIHVSASVRFNESVFPNRPAKPLPPASKPIPPVDDSVVIPNPLDEDTPHFIAGPSSKPVEQPPSPPSPPSPSSSEKTSPSSTPPQSRSPSPTAPSTEPTTPPRDSSSALSTPPAPNPSQTLPASQPTQRKSTRSKKKVQKYIGRTSELQVSTSEGVSWEKFDKDYLLFVQLYTSENPHGEPSTYREAIESPDSGHWSDAMADEIKSLEKMETWESVPRPADRKVIKCKWVYRLKLNAQGGVARYKARLVAKGYSQVPGIDYNETFAPVTRLETIRLLMALAVEKDWEIRQIDVKTAYLYGDLAEEIYMEPPEGYNVPVGHVLLLKKALYGLKQAGRQWYLKLKSILKEFGFKQVVCEPHTFVVHKVVNRVMRTLIVPVYVDDLIPIGDKVLAENFEAWIGDFLEVTLIGDASYFLGIRVTRSSRTQGEESRLVLDQSTFARTIVERKGIPQGQTSKTPLPAKEEYEPNPVNVSDADPATVKQYQKDIGSLMYLMLGSRPDLAYAVGKLARFSSNPSPEHLEAVTRIYRYVNGTFDHSLVYVRSADADGTRVYPTGFTDSNYAQGKDRKSTSGYLFGLSRGVFSWSSKKQSTIAESTMEAEAIGIHQASRQITWIRNLYGEIKVNLEGPITLLADSQPAIAVLNEPQSHQRTKNLDVGVLKVRERITDGLLKLVYVSTEDNMADILTKSLPKDRHRKLVSAMAMGPLRTITDSGSEGDGN
jgi:transposase InsO family protein